MRSRSVTCSHTSGIPDATVGATPDEVIQHVAKLPMKFSPGEQYAYSNAGYTILGRIIERVSEKPLDLYLDERIYRPLQMNWTARGFEAVKNVSTGYQWEDNTLKRIYTGNA